MTTLETTLTDDQRAILRRADEGFRRALAATARYAPTPEGTRIRRAIERRTRYFWAEWHLQAGLPKGGEHAESG
jgi:hypothetical protein